MNVLIDGRSIVSNPTGIGQYLINALIALARNKPNWQFIVSAPRSIDQEAAKRVEQFSNIVLEISPTKIFSKINYFWFITNFRRSVKTNKADLIWYPAAMSLPFKPKNVKELVTVHDLVHKEFRSTMSTKNKIANLLFVDRSVNRADFLWAVSQYTKTAVEKYYPKRKAKSIVVGSSINTEFYHPIQVSVQEKAELFRAVEANENKKQLLFVGTLEPRKNIKFLLFLMPILAQQGYELIVVGGKGWGNTDIAVIVNQSDFPRSSVHFAGYLTNEQLRALYNTVDCFVSTSLNEGFGMPQLEALFCGAVVVTAGNSAMNEVVEGAGVIVDGWEIEQWCDAIQYAVENKEAFEQQRQEKIEKYQWGEISQTIAEYIS